MSWIGVFVKDASPVLTKPINYIVNLSITSGIVPDQLKSAQVKPILTSCVNFFSKK